MSLFREIEIFCVAVGESRTDPQPICQPMKKSAEGLQSSIDGCLTQPFAGPQIILFGQRLVEGGRLLDMKLLERPEFDAQMKKIQNVFGHVLGRLAIALRFL